MLNLDTHILIAAVEGRLRRDEQELLSNDFWCISDMVLWEIGHLARMGRVRTGPDHGGLREVVGRLTVWPIDLEIARALRQLDFRGDPADELIAATSLVHGIPLVTRDARMLASRVVPLALS